MSDVLIRELGSQEVAEVKWALYEAVSRDAGRELAPFEITIEHP